MQQRHVIFLLLPLFLVLGCQTKKTEAPCGVEVRAAFDVGSGSTKMRVAKLDTCTKKVLATLVEDQIKVDYREALDKSKDDLFPQATMDKGFKALETLKEKAVKKGAVRFTGVATAAFRQAKNSDDFILRVRENLGIPLRVISQNLEGLIGFQAASLQTQKELDKIVMWDIGGGSQQMVSLNEKSQPIIYQGQIASVTFKNHVIEKIQKKSLKKASSPNPLKKRDVEKAVAYASAQANESVPEEIKNKISQKSTTVFGIGGVLSKSLQRQLKSGPTVSQAQLKKTLDKRTGMTDGQIKDQFAATEITNLALVYGYMKALKLDSYRAIDVSLVDGLWFQPDIWSQ